MKGTSLLETDGDKSVIGVSVVILEGFRNYLSQKVSLAPGFNVLTGNNAQGKTNFLESIYMVSTTRLLRGQRDAEAILTGHSRATVVVHTLETDTRLGVVLEAGIRKRASINGLSLPRAADLIGRLPSVCISTADMEIVRGEPADRRLFLDLELSNLSPGYLRHLTHYKRALEQRNALLRDSRESAHPGSVFEPWEAQIAHHGAAMRVARLEYVGQLRPIAHQIHHAMGDGERLDLVYTVRDDATDEDLLLAGLASSRYADIARGGTSVGPHRDDLGVSIDGREARTYGSQGQQRTSVISLKLATLQVAKERFGGAPILLLDDILSDLDKRRRKQLIEAVFLHAGQAILTCTEASAAGDRILERARLFSVSAGNVEQL